MKKHKTWLLIQSLSDQERRSFRQCLSMEQFNREQYVTRLFDLLLQQHASANDNKSIFAQLYPEDKFNDGRIRYLKTQLFRLLKKFIFLQQPQMLFEDVAIFSYLREKKLAGLYQKEENKIKSLIQQHEPDDSQGYLQRYFLSFEWHNFHTKTNRIATEYLEQLNLNLDLFFIIEKLKLACTAFNLQRLYKVQAETSLIEPILQHIYTRNLQDKHPLLGVYFYAYLMLTNSDPASYFRLKSYLLDKDRHYPADEIKDAYLLALNFCIQQINKGNDDFYKDAFLFYEQGIEKFILLENGYLSPITYSNAITIALRGKDYENALLFINNYKKIVQGAEQEEYYFFNLSKYYFETGNFEKVIELYYQSNLKELLLNIQVRIIQIKAFFEKKELELCQNLNDNLQQMLSRKGILAYHKENYSNICKAFNLLLALNRHDRQARQKFLLKLESLSPLTEKNWFVEKAG